MSLGKTIKEIALAIGIAIPNLLLLWKYFSERNKKDPQVRLIRNKALQEKTKIQSEAALKKLQIEEAAIKEEVKHLARIKGIEIGVAEIEKKESVDLLTKFKEKTTNLVKDKVGDLGTKLKVDKFFDKDQGEK